MSKKIKKRIFEIIFEADTRAGKVFDILLLIIISLSVIVVMLDSVSYIHLKYGTFFHVIEWIITILFTVEYTLRIYSTHRPIRYVFSFYGIIDLMSIIPTYLSIFISGTNYLLVIRILRLMRIFRVFKLTRYINASDTLLEAMKKSGRKILVFLEAVLIIVVITGSLMYIVEGSESGFTSIPKSIYWAIVTITTVGYGDIAPQTVLGQTIASALMIIGFAIIAVPTSIVGSELLKSKVKTNTQVCIKCHKKNHDDDAKYCSNCGEKL